MYISDRNMRSVHLLLKLIIIKLFLHTATVKSSGLIILSDEGQGPLFFRLFNVSYVHYHLYYDNYNENRLPDISVHLIL